MTDNVVAELQVFLNGDSVRCMHQTVKGYNIVVDEK